MRLGGFTLNLNGGIAVARALGGQVLRNTSPCRKVSSGAQLEDENKPDDFILVIVMTDSDRPSEPRYIRKPFQKEPDFGVTSVNYELKELLRRGEVPA